MPLIGPSLDESIKTAGRRLTRLRGGAAPEAVLWPLTRSNRASAGSGTEFGGLLGAAGAAAAAVGAFGECPLPRYPFRFLEAAV
ncbi:hypothetical protein HispidOSU_028195 [Sigmodon hispidus]